MLPLLLLITLIPLTELWLIVKFSGLFGFWTTLAVMLGTGFAGAALARWQGAQALMRLQSELRDGRLPAQALGDGALIFVAGIFLVTPGMISDCLGLALLIPPIRALVMKGIRRWIATHVRVEASRFHYAAGGDTVRNASTVVDARVIDMRSAEEEQR